MSDFQNPQVLNNGIHGANALHQAQVDGVAQNAHTLGKVKATASPTTYPQIVSLSRWSSNSETF